jgi:cation transport protein ChaC
LTDEELSVSLTATLGARPKGAGWWVFAYGSLLWNPLFPFAEARRARLHGFHRRFCLWSLASRGRPEAPGLVLGLDRGGSCHGIAYRLPPAHQAEVFDRIWAREMTGRVYHMRRVTARTEAGAISAYACVARRDSPDYAGRLSVDDMARLLARAVGGRGTGRDYLANTLRHIEEMAIPDSLLHRVEQRVRAITG